MGSRSGVRVVGESGLVLPVGGSVDDLELWFGRGRELVESSVGQRFPVVEDRWSGLQLVAFTAGLDASARRAGWLAVEAGRGRGCEWSWLALAAGEFGLDDDVVEVRRGTERLKGRHRPKRGGQSGRPGVGGRGGGWRAELASEGPVGASSDRS